MRRESCGLEQLSAQMSSKENIAWAGLARQRYLRERISHYGLDKMHLRK